MKKKIIMALAAFSLSGALMAGEIQLIEEALELSADQIILPVSSTGKISVRKCRDCTVQQLPLNTLTEFLIEKSPVSLTDFRLAAGRSKAIYVFYDIETGFVTRMVLDMPHKAAGLKTR